MVVFFLYSFRVKEKEIKFQLQKARKNSICKENDEIYLTRQVLDVAQNPK